MVQGKFRIIIKVVACFKLILTFDDRFLGSKVCYQGIQRGWNVASVSRRVPSYAFQNHGDGGFGMNHSSKSIHWSRKVNWITVDDLTSSGNPFKENAVLAEAMDKASAVVYCLGSIMNSTLYKDLINGSSGPSSIISKLVLGASTSHFNQEGALESLNFTTAVKAASELKDKKPFVYISADPRAFSLLPIGGPYLESKARAEGELTSPNLSTNNITPIIFRPGKQYFQAFITY